MSLYYAYVKQRQHAIRAVEVRTAEIVIDSMEPIDWKQVIINLMSSGVSMRRIALTICVAQPTVKGWYDGSIPNYEAGRKLLVMASTVARIPVTVNQDEAV